MERRQCRNIVILLIMDKAGNEDDRMGMGAADRVVDEHDHWWEVVRKAEIRGELKDVKKKGLARKNSRQTVSFQWSFRPSNTSAATRSPWFEWLGLLCCGVSDFSDHHFQKAFYIHPRGPYSWI